MKVMQFLDICRLSNSLSAITPISPQFRVVRSWATRSRVHYLIAVLISIFRNINLITIIESKYGYFFSVGLYRNGLSVSSFPYQTNTTDGGEDLSKLGTECRGFHSWLALCDARPSEVQGRFIPVSEARFMRRDFRSELRSKSKGKGDLNSA